MSHSTPQLCIAPQYITDLILEVSKAKKRIYIMSLILTDDVATHGLIEALLRAAERHVTIYVAADTFTYSELGGYFSPLKYTKKASLKVQDMTLRFKQAGIHFTWLGDRNKLNPFAGVTHIKWTVVDDSCYLFGGVNLYEEGIESADYMFRYDDPHLADEIARQHKHILDSEKTPRKHTSFIQQLPIGTFYIDSGKKHESIIYDRACTLAQQAEHVLYVSQYCPSGPLAGFLLKKHATVFYNQPRTMSFPTNLLFYWDRLRTRLPSLYMRSQYVHAKFIIFTMKNGEKVALTGSHNFSHLGVRFGTREAVLETSDTSIIEQLLGFYARFIRS